MKIDSYSFVGWRYSRLHASGLCLLWVFAITLPILVAKKRTQTDRTAAEWIALLARGNKTPTPPPPLQNQRHSRCYGTDSSACAGGPNARLGLGLQLC